MTPDLQGITTKPALHELFKARLGFPNWYGPSWDAFFDCIVALVELPDYLMLANLQAFAQACPQDMAILRQVMEEYAAEKPGKHIMLV